MPLTRTRWLLSANNVLSIGAANPIPLPLKDVTGCQDLSSNQRPCLDFAIVRDLRLLYQSQAIHSNLSRLWAEQVF